MTKFKAFSDVVFGSSFNSDGIAWHGFILSTKQWAQIFLILVFPNFTTFSDGFELRKVGERKQYQYFCFSFIRKYKLITFYFINSFTCKKDEKTLHKFLHILEPYHWNSKNRGKSPVYLPHILITCHYFSTKCLNLLVRSCLTTFSRISWLEGDNTSATKFHYKITTIKGSDIMFSDTEVGSFTLNSLSSFIVYC